MSNTTYEVDFWEEDKYRRDEKSPFIIVAGKMRTVRVDAPSEVHIPFKLRSMGYKPYKIYKHKTI
jgi:hypothetical protein